MGGGSILVADRLRQMAWTNCPECPAVIQSGCVYRSDDDQRPYIVFIRYSYEAESRTYFGFCSPIFSTSEDALQFIEMCRASRTVARYKPESPEESCLFVDIWHIAFDRTGVA
jgi:hypothetical protein